MSQADQLYEAASALSAAAGTYASTSNAEVGISTSIAYTVGDLQQTWKGMGSQGFMGAWNRAVRDAANSSEALANASTALTNLASAINSNLQPFEDLARVNVDKPSAVANVQRLVDEATSAIQIAANTAVGALGAIEPTVGFCSTGTETLPQGWNVTLNYDGSQAKYYGPGWYAGPGWYIPMKMEGMTPLVKISSNGPNDPPTGKYTTCSPDLPPFSWQNDLGLAITSAFIGSSTSAYLSGGLKNKQAILNMSASAGAGFAVNTGWGEIYKRLQGRWQWVCNVSKNPAGNKAAALIPSTLNTVVGVYVINHFWPANPPKSTPTSGPTGNPGMPK